MVADTIAGTATYAGDAAGVYVHDSLGATTGSTAGTFTADVSLTAYFGGPDVAVNKKNTIDGSISNFDLSGGEPNAWGISLKADFDATPDDWDWEPRKTNKSLRWNGGWRRRFRFMARDIPWRKFDGRRC